MNVKIELKNGNSLYIDDIADIMIISNLLRIIPDSNTNLSYVYELKDLSEVRLELVWERK